MVKHLSTSILGPNNKHQPATASSRQPRISAVDKSGELTIFLGQGANLKKVYSCSDLSWSPSTVVPASVNGFMGARAPRIHAICKHVRKLYGEN